MKIAILAFVLLCGIAICSHSINRNFHKLLNGKIEPSQANIAELYSTFRYHYRRGLNADDFLSRYHTFRENVLSIIEHNSNPSSTFKKGINKFTDMTQEQVNDKMIGAPQDCSATEHNLQMRRLLGAPQIPQNFDWRDDSRNIVTPVKNQGQCGSCWTFSTTGCLQAHWKLHKNETVVLSEQQLVDCAGDFDNHGCNGGLPSHAFQYIKHNGGLEGEATYPYKAMDQNCTFNLEYVLATVQGGSFNITEGDEAELQQAIYDHGPVSVAFQVYGDFSSYVSGVYKSSECGNTTMDVNHAVLAVGWGVTDDGQKYWIIKNSWGPDWGNQGYFWIERGTNMCGIAVCNSFPLLDASSNRFVQAYE